MTAEIQVLEQNSNVIVEAYKVKGGAQSLFDRIAEQARSIVPDLSTDKGRKAIASMARKVASSKTAFDAHGKELKEQYTAITSKIDADRKLFRDQCDALRDEIRKPLTDWENAEKDRVQAIQDKIAQFDSGRVDIGSPLSLILSVIAEIEAIAIDESFAEYQEHAKLQKYECLEVLRKVQVDREKYEAEQALIREQQLKEQAEQQARQDEIDKALDIERAEQTAKQAEHNKQLAIQAERERIEREVREKEEAERKEQERREADKAHKKQVCDAILAELAKINIDEKTGQDLIKAIYNNQIPNIKITF